MVYLCSPRLLEDGVCSFRFVRAKVRVARTLRDERLLAALDDAPGSGSRTWCVCNAAQRLFGSRMHSERRAAGINYLRRFRIVAVLVSPSARLWRDRLA
jgi:hypothetical protein